MRAEEIKGLIEAYSKVHKTPEILNELIAAQQQAKNDAAAASRLTDIEKRGGQLGMLNRTFRRITGQNTSASDAADKASEARARQAGARAVGQYYSSTTGKDYKDYKTALSDPKVKASVARQQQIAKNEKERRTMNPDDFFGTKQENPPESSGDKGSSGSGRGGSGTGGSGGGSGGGSRNVVSAKNIAGQQQKVTVGKQYAATLGGKKGNVTYDSSGKRTFTADKSSTSPSTTGAQKPTTTTTPKPSGMDIWKSKYKDTLAKNVTTSGTQKGTGQSQMSKQAAELRDMQKASQIRQSGGDAMGSNITSVRQDLEKANKPENLNKPAPAGTALEKQQKMTALKKPSPDLKMDLDIFDLVKGHLLDEGYAETEQNAIAMMANMSEEWRNSILDELYKGKHGQSEKEYQAGRSDAGKRISGDDKDGPASYASRWHKDSKPTKPGEKPKNTQKVSKNELDNARARYKSVSGKSWNKVGGPKGLPEEVEINEKVERWIQKVIDESSKTDDGTRARIKMFAGKKGIEFEPGPRWDPSANRGKGAHLSDKQIEKQRRKKLRSEEYMDEAQRARENPEDHDKEEKRKYEPVRGERTPMPPRGDKRREDFEKWYRANVR